MRRVILAIVSTAAALVFLLSFKTHSTSALATSVPSASASPTPSSSAPASTASPTASSKASSGSAAKTASTAKTVTGSVTQTMYGPIEVRITVKNGKVTAAEAVEYPDQDPRDAQINSYAIPALNSEAVSASSAQIDTVSGATYTSDGYISSLQSALDKAGL
ncbi:MAG TPA: FMN-binding protein [Trebonia sp.]